MVLQHIFLREAFEIRIARPFNGRTYPFEPGDLDGERPEVFVKFGFTNDGGGAMIPGPVI